MMISLYRNLLAALILLASLTACALRTRVPVNTPVDIPAATQISIVLPSPETPAAQETPAQPTTAAQPSLTAAPTATLKVIPNLPAAITAQGVNLRQGPGTLFDRLGLLDEGAQLTVTGKARGDDWVFVNTGDRQGWVSVRFTSLFLNDQLAFVPVLDTGDSVVIQGRVTMKNGMPLAGIEFAAFQGKEDSEPPSTRAHSLVDGSFYIYLPPDSSGTWRISLTAVDCKSSIVDANCNYTGAFMPRFTDITLPNEKVLEFQYSK